MSILEPSSVPELNITQDPITLPLPVPASAAAHQVDLIDLDDYPEPFSPTPSGPKPYPVPQSIAEPHTTKSHTPSEDQHADDENMTFSEPLKPSTKTGKNGNPQQNLPSMAATLNNQGGMNMLLSTSLQRDLEKIMESNASV